MTGPSILGAGLWEEKEGKKKSHIDLPSPLQLTGTPFLSCLASVFVACTLCTTPHWATPGSKPGDMRGKARELTPLEVLLQVLASVSNLLLLLTFQSPRVVAFKNFVFFGFSQMERLAVVGILHLGWHQKYRVLMFKCYFYIFLILLYFKNPIYNFCL